MPRYKLRTLLILLAIGPPMLAYLGRQLALRLMYGPPSIGYNGAVFAPGGGLRSGIVKDTSP